MQWNDLVLGFGWRRAVAGRAGYSTAHSEGELRGLLAAIYLLSSQLNGQHTIHTQKKYTHKTLSKTYGCLQKRLNIEDL